MVAAAEKERKAGRRTRPAQDTQKGNFMRAVLTAFPLLLIPVGLYFMLAMIGGGGANDALGQAVQATISPLQATLDKTFFQLPMISGVKWRLTNGDAIVLLSIVFLFLEILKSTSTGTSTIMNHAVSMGLFILCLVLFLLNASFATSTFFILMAMTLLDVLAGVVVTIVSARRDFGMENEH
jgi:hypothetical protein